MQTDGEKVHVEMEGARAGSTPNVTRWVLLFGLGAAIILLTLIWVSGALITGPSKSHDASAAIRETQARQGGSGTDSIVGDHVDQTNATTKGESTDPQNMPNNNANGR